MFRRTGGVVGLLERLVEEGCAEAIDTGVEALAEDLLDGILINLGNDPSRNADAGEVPAVPTPKPTGKQQPNKPRSTVFDDAGIPAAANTTTA
jgi:hypothetical protein